MTLQNIRLAEGKIYYLEEGKGPNLLFLHGAIGTSQAYVPLLRRLAGQYHVIAPIHPGHGKSFTIPNRWKLNNFVLFYQDFLAEIGIVPEILVGHSFGGTLVLLLASAGIGKRAIVMDAPGLPFIFNLADYVAMLAVEGQNMLRQYSDREKFKETTKVAQTIVETIVRHPKNISVFSKFAPKYNITTNVKKISIPVDLLWGADDKIAPPEIGERLRTLIPNARLSVFEGFGHSYPVTHPEFTYSELSSILRTHDTT